jgi:hypothetical protein
MVGGMSKLRCSARQPRLRLARRHVRASPHLVTSASTSIIPPPLLKFAVNILSSGSAPDSSRSVLGRPEQLENIATSKSTSRYENDAFARAEDITILRHPTFSITSPHTPFVNSDAIVLKSQVIAQRYNFKNVPSSMTSPSRAQTIFTSENSATTLPNPHHT